ncbi:hypothetical protein [Pseudomonas izuensis]|uniref:LysM domain-containing protein n=1 Tax=Pseudomonas izuensis TaxID=2684212 RepID=A0ABM7RX54_9PSED|nr:hypothetical protein [Pseudomonas izuensis]BCX69097.1 hypothetical protein LAB08_R37390 [Pseudomonas izuensis]
MKADLHDLWEVNSAAGKLAGQARTISARHLAHGMARERFNREVAYYAKRVVDDVAQGRKTPRQGIQALRKEQHDLLFQSRAVMRKSRNAITDAVKRIPDSRLTHPVSKPDPQRLLRFVHAQNLKTTHANTPDALRAASSPHPAPDFIFLPREHWPAAVPPPEDPGFYIVPRSTTFSRLEEQLFTSASPAVIAKFKTLNPNLDQVKAGTMIVLSDPNNQQCTREEALLMEAAGKVNKALEPLSSEEADFMARHHDEIAFFLSKGSLGANVGLAMFSNNLDSVKVILRDIEALHTQTFQANGHLNSPEFYAQRKKLLTQLDGQLTQLTKKSIGFPDHPNLKSALGISSKSLVHRWRKSGAADHIPGYATHIEGVAKAAKYVKYGGWIGTVVGSAASVIKVKGVCGEGNVDACERVKYSEAGGFLGGIYGGVVIGAVLGAGTTGAMCAALGVPTGGVGTLVCGLVIAGSGSLAADIGGGKMGEAIGEVIYEVTK